MNRSVSYDLVTKAMFQEVDAELPRAVELEAETPGITEYLKSLMRIFVMRIANRLAAIMDGFPTIVCLCGSTRFHDEFRKANLEETLVGNIVLSIGCDFKSDDALGLTAADKLRLDELHKRKIDLADEILVINVDGYIGDSTRSEIEYAIQEQKSIRYRFPVRQTEPVELAEAAC